MLMVRPYCLPFLRGDCIYIIKLYASNGYEWRTQKVFFLAHISLDQLLTSQYILQIKMFLLLSDCKLLVDRVVSAQDLSFLVSEKRSMTSRLNFVWWDLKLIVYVVSLACLFYFFNEC